MQTLVEDFLQYLRHERGQADNTARTYFALLGRFIVRVRNCWTYRDRCPRRFRLSRKYLASSFGFTVVIFLGLFLGDFPKPNMDDLFFIGAGLNLAQDGDFTNPMLARQNFPSHFYFVHPPLYSFALAGWCELLGISATVLLGFQVVMYVLISVATIAVLKQHGVGKLSEYLVPFAVAAAFLPEGLRPEAFSVALTMVGFAMAICGEAGNLRRFGGFLLMILGGAAASRLTCFSGALVMTAMLISLRTGMTFRRVSEFLVLALTITCLVWLAMIDFKVSEFWQTYHFHAVGRLAGTSWQALKRFCASLSIIQWPLFFTGALGWLMLVRGQVENFRLSGWFLFMAFGAMACGGGLGHGGLWYFVMVAILATATSPGSGTKLWRKYFPWMLALALLVANSRNIIYCTGMMTGKITSQPGEKYEMARLLQPRAAHPLLVDSITARYVYDYRIPRGCLDWNFASKFPLTLPTDEPLRPEDIYLIGPDSVDWLNLRTHLNLPVPTWTPFRALPKTFHQNPRWAYIIRPIDCGGRKLGI